MSLRGFISDKCIMPLLLNYTQDPPLPFYKRLLDLEHATRDELKKYQWDKLVSIIDYAQKTVPYYSDSFKEADMCAKDLVTWEDLTRVPTINKQQISANFPDRITSKESNRDMWQYYATSGTTDRLMVIKDSEATSRNIALSLYEERIQDTYTPGLMHVSIPPDACSLACAASLRRPQGFIDLTKQALESLNQKGYKTLPRTIIGKTLRKIATPWREMPSFGTSGTRTDNDLIQWYLDKLHKWKPGLLSGLPEYLIILARHIKRSGQKPPVLKSLLPQGALTTPGMKKELRQVFNIPVHEVYGGHEFGCIASSCEQQDKLHIMMPECLVETVRNGKHVPPGELGEIVITVFSNKSMPLIRYRPGDIGRLYEDYCTCGRKTQLMTVEGRMQDVIVTPEKVRTPKQIIDFLWAWPNVEFAQLVQRNQSRCDLLIVEREDGHTDLNNLATLTSDFIGGGIQIRPRIVSTIKPEVSGKFRFVKSASYERFHDDNSSIAA